MQSQKILFIFLIIITSLALESRPSCAQGNSGDFGIGILLGEPTGVSVKSWFNNQTAFDVGAAWSVAGEEALHMHADLLGHSWFKQNEQLSVYYGIGGRIIFADDAEAGLRAPVGLNYIFEEIPFDLFIEAAPILNLTPEVGLAGNGAVGIRYYI